MSELHIPDAVADMGAMALRGYAIAESDLVDAASEVLQAAGPALVADELRRFAAGLYRRSDNVPLGRDGGGIERVGCLRDLADQMIARADELLGGAA